MFDRPGSILSAKSLPDGSMVLAIDYGHHVILVHQDIMEIGLQQTADWSGYTRLTQNHTNARVDFYTRETKLITREQYDESNYEHHMKRQDALSRNLAIEDKTR